MSIIRLNPHVNVLTFFYAFLCDSMSTILRIGSLMKVGFGSAGVEIIRKNLERGRSQNMLTFSSQGSTVSCIFVFCDIRNFTDATECLQEEVFVFTNQIAAVVHSYCAAYGGSANKNIGDAFLLSWSLDDVADGLGYTAKNNQADKALLAVVRMCMSLRYDEYYMGKMSQFARDALVTKLKNREGPIVQMGFGLHAGKAVQGAIGSQKKIDATYVSESVERSEFLESSTKKYGLLLLMSDDFHRLLDQRNKRRCRKVDQILMREDDGNEEEDDVSGEIMDLLTFDIDIDAWWGQGSAVEGITSAEQESVEYTVPKKQARQKPRKLSLFTGSNEPGDREAEMPSDLAMSKARRIMHGLEEVENSGMFGSKQREKKLNAGRRPEFLVLPRGPALYNANVWSNQDMRKIRERYSDGIFFQKFNSGLQAFYNRDWEHALECFSTVLSRFDDGPSRYFLNQIEKNNGKPPKDFRGYGVA